MTKEDPHMNFRQFYVVLKPEHECAKFRDIIDSEHWFEDRGTALLNAPDKSWGLLRVCLEIQRFNQEPACGAV